MGIGAAGEDRRHHRAGDRLVVLAGVNNLGIEMMVEVGFHGRGSGKYAAERRH